MDEPKHVAERYDWKYILITAALKVVLDNIFYTFHIFILLLKHNGDVSPENFTLPFTGTRSLGILRRKQWSKWLCQCSGTYFYVWHPAVPSILISSIYIVKTSLLLLLLLLTFHITSSNMLRLQANLILYKNVKIRKLYKIQDVTYHPFGMRSLNQQAFLLPYKGF